MNQQIWRWTLTKEAIAPCFVRDVLAMRKHNHRDVDFFWLGHTPCRTVLLVGMVVGIQVYEKRAIYTIDDGTAVIDCVLRHPHPILPAPKPRSHPSANADPQHCSPKKARLDRAKLETSKPPPPITEPGYPVRVVGRVVRHYQSKQIYADTINPCLSSLDEIAHLEHVVELHKTKYSLAIPFVPPPKPMRRIPPADISIPHAGSDADANVFSNTSHTGSSTALYTLSPPPMPVLLQSRNRLPSVPTHIHSADQDHTHVPSSPTASSITSSTPSSPCRPSSPIKSHQVPHKPKLRHPSRLHTRDLTGNIFRIYVKHYMDNAPPPFPISLSSPSRSVCGGLATPTRHARDEDGYDEPTPRPGLSARNGIRDSEGEDEGPTLGFTLSHLRRVPELALLAARVVRAEARRRENADREKERKNSHSRMPSSGSAPTRPNECKEGSRITADPPRKKMKRLFSWAVVKLYEEGSIVLWDGDVRPLPVPPPPVFEGDVGRHEDRRQDESRLWTGDDTRGTVGVPSVSFSQSYAQSTLADASESASVLYTSSASASLYSHYHPPRPSTKRRFGSGCEQADVREDVNMDANPGYVSDPGVDEEAYVSLMPQLLAGHVKEAVGALRCAQQGGGAGRGGAGVDGRESEITPENILAYLRRTDERWARVGVWVVEEVLTAVSKAG